MIACNACQLLATDLPFCHGLRETPGLVRFRSLAWDPKRPRPGSRNRPGQIDSSSSFMIPIGRWPRWRSPRILRIIRGFDLSVLRWCFIRFEPRCRGNVRLNLVELGAIMGYLKVIFGLSWVTWCYHGAVLIFFNLSCWASFAFYILCGFLLRDLTWIQV